MPRPARTDTVWPESQRSAQEVFDAAGVPDDEADLIAHGNAERVFGWKMASEASVEEVLGSVRAAPR